MENTDGQSLLQQNPPVNLLNPMALPFPYPYPYQDAAAAAHYLPFQNPNPVQSWDSYLQNDVIHPPGVEPAKPTHISSSGYGIPLPVTGYNYPQTEGIASSTSTSAHHYFLDPNVHLALAPFGTGITEPVNVAANLVPTSITSSLLVNQKVGLQNRGIKKKGPKKIKTVQSAWCEFCKVDCNSKSVLDQHKLGRKHKKNLKKLIAENACVSIESSSAPPALAPAPAPALPALAPASAPVSASTDVPAHAYVLNQCSAATLALAPASADIPAPTTHASVVTQCSAATPAETPAPPTHASVVTQCSAATPAEIPAPTTHASVEIQSSAATPAEPPTSADIPAPATVALPPASSTALVMGPNENFHVPKPQSSKKARKKASVNEDLETKKRKMLEGGVAAKDVRMCTICNVVCNSEMVFMNHLAGQKHAAMMKKSASATSMAATT